MEKNIEINKGNYEIETSERKILFEKYRGEGWEEEYKEYRKKWQENPKRKHINRYPLEVLFEVSSICNLQCPMCFTTSKEYKNKIKGGLMNFELYKKTIDEIKNEVPSVRLAGAGEATLNPDFINYIKYAKKAGIKEVSLVTNGSTLSEIFFKEMLFAGIDWISISIDGINETYEKIRKPLLFNDTLEKIEMIKRVKDKYNARKPVIQIQGLWTAIKNNLEEYYELFSKCSDLICYQALIDYENKNIEYDEKAYCSEIYQRLYVSFDGKVYPCCTIGADSLKFLKEAVIGDLQKESILEIWNGDNLMSLREKHNNADYKKRHGGFCDKCPVLQKIKKKEVINFNGENITIKSYI